jgi:hypothetical protein
MRALLGFGLSLAVTVPALAEDWPPQIGAELAERQEYCKQQGGKAAIAETFLRRVDLDGDGRDDFIMDDAGFRCSEGVPLYCGSGGCQVQVFMGRADGAHLVFSRLAQQSALKGRVFEVSQGKNYPKITVHFEGGCAIPSGGKKKC